MDGGEMIKRSKDNSLEVEAYVCDHCTKEMPGLPIRVYYPYGHINVSEQDGPSHFCSDKCLVDFQHKLTRKYGPWKSTPITERVRASEEDTKAYTRQRTTTKTGDNPKARRGTRKLRKPNAPEEA